MKKFGALFVAMAFVFSLASIGLASGSHSGGHKTKGEVVKTAGAFVTVKDEHGKSHKFHVNKSTHLKGKVKVGVKVHVESTEDGGGHAISMTVVD